MVACRGDCRGDRAVSRGPGITQNGLTKILALPGPSVSVGGWFQTNNADEIRRLLIGHGALVASFTIHPTFNRYRSGIYDHDKALAQILSAIPVPQGINPEALRGPVRALFSTGGGHAVSVIGYFKGGQLDLADFETIFMDKPIRREAL